MRITWEHFAKEFKIDDLIKDGKYNDKGKFFEHLDSFPGALFDPNGYVIFKTEAEYLSNKYLQHGKKLNVSFSISMIPGYVKVK